MEFICLTTGVEIRPIELSIAESIKCYHIEKENWLKYLYSETRRDPGWSLGLNCKNKRPNWSDRLDHSADAKEHGEHGSVEEKWLCLELLLWVTNQGRPVCHEVLLIGSIGKHPGLEIFSLTHEYCGYGSNLLMDERKNPRRISFIKEFILAVEDLQWSQNFLPKSCSSCMKYLAALLPLKFINSRKFTSTTTYTFTASPSMTRCS